MIALVLVGQGERRGRLQQQLQLLPVLRAVGCYRLYLIRKLNVIVVHGVDHRDRITNSNNIHKKNT